MKPYDFYEANKREIENIFSEFSVVEFPTGFIGEINEAMEQLQRNDRETDKKNVISYLKAKIALMLYFRNEEPELMKSYTLKDADKTAGGLAVPEWVITTALMLGLFIDVVALGTMIRSILEKELPKEDKKVISQKADQIVNIKEVKEFNVIINIKKDD